MEVEINYSLWWRSVKRKIPWQYVGVWLLLLGVCLLQAPGRISADTKLDLSINPQAFLVHALHLWDSRVPLGQVQNQAYGYFFPQGLFYVLIHWLHIPVWIGQRLWWSLCLFAGFTGIMVLARALSIGSSRTRVCGAVGYIFAPRVLATLGEISSETLPYMLAPWIAVGVVRAMGDKSAPLWRLALGSSFAVVLCGAVNAVANIAAMGFGVLWLLCYKPDRSWRVFASWWAATLMLMTLWWTIPLLILGRVSTPFLDYIESSRVTTKWMSAPEIIRGTGNWSPFVSQIRQIGYEQVTQWVYIVATMILAAIGLMGLCMASMPYRRNLVIIFGVGVVIFSAGFAVTEIPHLSWACGSWIASGVQDFLDGSGKALRNVHKCEPLLRIPVTMGLIHCLYVWSSQVREAVGGSGVSGWSLVWAKRGLLGSNPVPAWGGIVSVLVATVVVGVPVARGQIASGQSFTGVPKYWQQAAQWLGQHSPHQRVLVVPGAPASHQLWGFTSDPPLQPYALSPWAIRDAIPLVPSEGIRWLDAVENAMESGFEVRGLARMLADAGFKYVLVAGDVDVVKGRTLSPFLARQTLLRSPGFVSAASFGVAQYPHLPEGIVLSDGVQGGFTHAIPALTVFEITAPGVREVSKMYSVPVASMSQVQGGAEAALLQHIFDSDQQQGWSAPSVMGNGQGRYVVGDGPQVITDTPLLRETDFGRVFDNHSAVRAPGDVQRVPNRVSDYVSWGTPVVGQWHGARVEVSSSAADAVELGQVFPGKSAASMFDGSPDTAWVSRNLTTAVGQWVQVTFDHPYRLMAMITTAKTLGSQVSVVRASTDLGSAYTQGVSPGHAVPLTMPYGFTQHVRITAVDTSNHEMGNQFSISQLQFFDADTGRPIPISFSVKLPAISEHTVVREWLLGQQSPGHDECVQVPVSGVMCSLELGLLPQEKVFSRTLSVPTSMKVSPTVLLRSYNSAAMGDMLLSHGVKGVHIAADGNFLSPQGSALALLDDNSDTVWTGKIGDEPSNTTDHKPVVTITFDTPQKIDRVRFDPPHGSAPAPVQLVAINTGYGRWVRAVHGGQWIHIPATTTQRLTITALRWKSVMSVNDLGFSSMVAPGFAGIHWATVDHQVFPQWNDHAMIDTGCAQGPVLAVSGHRVHLRVQATVGQVRRHDIVQARMCPTAEAAEVGLMPGEQEMVIDPGEGFSVVAVRLRNVQFPQNAQFPQMLANDSMAARDNRQEVLVDRVWNASHRVVSLAESSQPRIVFVPESFNAGWRAIVGGQMLVPVVVNGWQQGWYVPPGLSGSMDISYPLDAMYRSAIFVGMGLAVLVALGLAIPHRWLVAILPRRALGCMRSRHRGARSWRLSLGGLGVMMLGLGAVVCSLAGMVIAGGVIMGVIVRLWFSIKSDDRGVRRLWRVICMDVSECASACESGGAAAVMSSWWCRRIPLWCALGCVGSGLVLAHSPWRSAGMYGGYSPWAQWWGLCALLMMELSVLIAASYESFPLDHDQLQRRDDAGGDLVECNDVLVDAQE